MDARRRFGEREEIRDAAESYSGFLSALQTSQVHCNLMMHVKPASMVKIIFYRHTAIVLRYMTSCNPLTNFRTIFVRKKKQSQLVSVI